MQKINVANIFLFLIAVFLVVVVFELISPIFLTVCLTYNNCPNVEYNVENIEFNMSVKLNQDGFRDHEFTLEGRDRIAVIGDSQVFGWGVEVNHTFSTLLEKEIRKEVINLGIEGTGLDTYLKTTEGYSDYADTIILVLFTGNDFPSQENSKQFSVWNLIKNGCKRSELCKLGFKSYSKLINRNLGPRNSKNPLSSFDLDDFNKTNSTYLKWALEWKINPYLIPDTLRYPNMNEYYNLLNGAFDGEIPTTKKILSDIIHLTEDKNTRLIVVLLPQNILVSNSYVEGLEQMGFFLDPNSLVCNMTLHNKIVNFLYEYNVEVIDLQEEMCNSSFADSFYYKIDGHLNEEGHRFISKILSSYLNTEREEIRRNNTK